MQARKRALTGTEPVGTLTLDIPVFITVRHECLSFKPPSLWCLLAQPELRQPILQTMEPKCQALGAQVTWLGSGGGLGWAMVGVWGARENSTRGRSACGTGGA